MIEKVLSRSQFLPTRPMNDQTQSHMEEKSTSDRHILHRIRWRGFASREGGIAGGIAKSDSVDVPSE
jgi:hypothetical protein